MANNHMSQPMNTEVRISPFSQRVFQFGTEDSRLYLSKATNGLLLPYIYGYRLPEKQPSNPDAYAIKLKYNDRLDCVVDGLVNEGELTESVFTVKVDPGQCIVDTTLLMFPTSCELSVDLNTITPSTSKIRVLLSVRFQWLETLYEQPPILKLTVIDPEDTTNYGPEIWETRIDRLIITYYDIDLDTKEVVNAYPNPTLHYTFDFIDVKNVPYEVAPPIQFLYNFNEFCKLNYMRKHVVWTQPCINPEKMIEDQITFPMRFFSSEQHPIIGFSYDIIYDPSLLRNPGVVINRSIGELGKTVDVYVDKDPQGNETGLIRIQIGENSANLTLLPDLKIGDITFYFTPNSPEGTQLQIQITNITCSYNNGTIGTIPFIPRQPATVDARIQVPVATYLFQPPDINFGKITLSPNLRFLFNLNNILQEFLLTDSIITELTTNGSFLINYGLKCYLDPDGNFFIEGLDRNIVFTDPIINSSIKDTDVLYFKEETNSSEVMWNVSNPNYYWTLSPGDIIHFDFEGKDQQSFMLHAKDVDLLLNNQDNWVVLPSLDYQIFETKFTIDPITALNKISFRISQEYENDYIVKNCTITIRNGNGYSNHAPIIHEFRQEEHVYDLNGIDLSGNEETGLDEITVKIPNENELTIHITDDILTVLHNSDFGYREQNIQIWINKVTNTLHITSVFYNTTFETTTVVDRYINHHEPDETQVPCLWFIDSFVSTRPIGNPDFIPDPDLIYTDCWKLGDFNQYSSGERDFFVEFEIANYFKDFDVQVQVSENNIVIDPMGIQIVPEECKVRIWMPESFVFEKPMKQLKINVMG